MSFQNFHGAWLDDLRQLLHQLQQALKQQPETAAAEHHLLLSQLVEKTISHFIEYYRVKGLYAKEDILSIIKSPWSTSLERGFFWVAGWRPVTVFHLIYTETSIRFESQMINILQGIHSGDLGDLSSAQLNRISELQCETVVLENSISDQLSQWQDSVGELVGEFILGNNVEDEKMEELVRIVERADGLRLKTIQDLSYLMNTTQAVEFLIAAIELQIGVRGWGFDFNRLRTDKVRDTKINVS